MASRDLSAVGPAPAERRVARRRPPGARVAWTGTAAASGGPKAPGVRVQIRNGHGNSPKGLREAEHTHADLYLENPLFPREMKSKDPAKRMDLGALSSRLEIC